MSSNPEVKAWADKEHIYHEELFLGTVEQIAEAYNILEGVIEDIVVSGRAQLRYSPFPTWDDYVPEESVIFRRTRILGTPAQIARVLERGLNVWDEARRRGIVFQREKHSQHTD